MNKVSITITRLAVVLGGCIAFGSVNAAVEGLPLTTEEARPYFDKPYMEFAKVWMKEDMLRKAGNVLSFQWGSASDITRTFYNNPSNNNAIEKSALDTFSAYCDFQQGTATKLRQEMFCAKDDKPLAHMKWHFKSKDKGDLTDEIIFVHEVGQLAQLSLNKKQEIRPGAEISTRYGRGLVIETKEGGLINFQPKNGQLRWITTDDVLNW